MNSRFSILWLCFLVCYAKGGTNDSALMPNELPPPWTLVTNTPAKLDTSYMRVIGNVTSQDKDEILLEVATIKDIYPVVAEIKALGDEFYTPAARVILSEKYTVYLVRLQNGHWVISDVILRES